ncbi:AAA family ATPase [bacterium]|nr:AAA family ATPase [bacterium]
MGIYINAGNENFKAALAEEIFVDKSLILQKLCSVLNTRSSKFICVSRPRRFGKSIVRDLMNAYFSKGCDSLSLFENLKIANPPKKDNEPAFDFRKNLNKFNTLSIDMGAFFSRAENKNDILKELKTKLRKDFRKEFPTVEFDDNDSIAGIIAEIYDQTKEQFVIIIDEYDVLVRERIPKDIFKEYLELLNSLFKNNELSPAIALAYLTGILPIVRDKVQSKLNVFDESTMLSPFGMEEFFGFTKEETEALCNEYGMSFAECEEWYDGYRIGELDIYNPNSVVKAMMRRECANYWHTTGSYEVVSDYIKLDYDGVKTAVIDMIAGKEVRVDIGDFENSLDKINTKDDVLTYLIHLGYVNYDKKTGLCRIPNKEIRLEWEKAIKIAGNFAKIVEMIKDSEELLELTLDGEAEEVAAALNRAHEEVSSIKNYNRESSLQAAIILAYYTAKTKYTIIQELPAGRGFADIGFIPKNPKDPAILIELKCNQDADTAIKQIKNKNYPKVFENYLNNLLLVGVNYDKTTKVHECVIEKYQR